MNGIGAPQTQIAAPQHVSVRVHHLAKSFGQRELFRDLNLEIRNGEFVVLLGPSGCGKSTLARILAGLDDEFGGTVEVTPDVAVAFQNPRLIPWMRAWKNVKLGSSAATRAQAHEMLQEVQIEHLAQSWPKSLSGGEAQRVSLARALIGTPGLLILDEPFAALDAFSRYRAQTLVGSLWRRHRPSILMVTHDIEEALKLANRIIVMNKGEIAATITVGDEDSRDPFDPLFIARKREILDILGFGDGAPVPDEVRSEQEAGGIHDRF